MTIQVCFDDKEEVISVTEVPENNEVEFDNGHEASDMYLCCDSSTPDHKNICLEFNELAPVNEGDRSSIGQSISIGFEGCTLCALDDDETKPLARRCWARNSAGKLYCFWC